MIAVVCFATASGCTGYMNQPFDDEAAPKTSVDDQAEVDDDDPVVDDDERDECASQAAPLTRLNKWEYNRTLEDLFPNTDLPELAHPESSSDHGFDNYAADLEPTAQHVQSHVDNGRLIASSVMEDADAFVPCRPSGDSFRECGRQVVETFGKRAFRRPLTDVEIDEYAKFYESPPEGASFEQATELTIQFMLAAPEFIYRIDHPAADVDPGEATRVDAYSLASRMSYFLWGTMPDETLMQAAADGELDTQEGVQAQAERMVQNPRALETFLHFHENWLKMEELEHASKSDADNFDHETRQAMREETNQFLSEVIFRDEGTLTDLLTSRETFVNGRLASLYGVQAPEAEWGRVTLPENQRAGLFTQPTFLASRAHPDKPSPVLRGVHILQDIMCIGLGGPPDDANQQADAAAETLEAPYTNREYYDATTMQGSCASCHTKINGIGYAFENFDTMGRWRESEDNGLPVDASGNIGEQEYDNAIGLMEVMAGSERVEECVADKWMLYARGSEVLVDNKCVANDVMADFRDSGRSLRDLPLMIVTHPEFARMRVPAESEQE
jgi:hypothetical protein